MKLVATQEDDELEHGRAAQIIKLDPSRSASSLSAHSFYRLDYLSLPEKPKAWNGMGRSGEAGIE